MIFVCFDWCRLNPSVVGWTNKLLPLQRQQTPSYVKCWLISFNCIVNPATESIHVWNYSALLLLLFFFWFLVIVFIFVLVAIWLHAEFLCVCICVCFSRIQFIRFHKLKIFVSIFAIAQFYDTGPIQSKNDLLNKETNRHTHKIRSL